MADQPYTGANLGPLRPKTGSTPDSDPYASAFGDAPPAGAPKADDAAATSDSGDYSQAFSDKPPEEAKPTRDIGVAEAGVKGLGNAATFGLSPAIAGLAEASGMPSAAPEGSDGVDLNPIRPIVGAAKLLHNYLSDHPDPEVQAAYQRGRQAQLGDEASASEQHPYPYIAGQLVGALAAPLGAVGDAAGLAARTGKSLLAGATGGGLYGAGDAISSGQSPADIAAAAGKGALTGAAFGTAAGAGGHVIGEGVDKAASIFRGTRDVDAEAGRRVVNALQSDMEANGPQMGREEITAANAAGTPRAIVDTGGEQTRALARSSANTSPQGRQALTEMTQSRFEDQSPRVGGFIRRITGGANADADNEVLQQAARTANKPAYARAYREGDKEIFSPELDRLMGSPAVVEAMRKASLSGKDRAIVQGLGAMRQGVTVENGVVKFTKGRNGVPTYPNLAFWDATKRELDDAASAAGHAGRKGEASVAGDLATALRDELDRHVRSYKAARQGAAAFFGAEDALEAGQKFVMSNANINEARRAISKMSGAEKELFARGFASDLADKIERTGDNRNVLNSIFLNNGPARQKINIALGAQRANQLEALLRAEHVIDQARKAVSGNSTTYRQAVEGGLAGAGAVTAFEGLKEHEFNPLHVLAAALTFGSLKHGAKVIDSRVARRVGEMLASHDSSVLAKGVKIVAGTPGYLDALRRATAAGVRIGARDIGPDKTAAGAFTLGQRVLNGPSGTASEPSHDSVMDQLQ